MNVVAHTISNSKQEDKDLKLASMWLGMLPEALVNDLHDHPFLAACTLCV